MVSVDARRRVEKAKAAESPRRKSGPTFSRVKPEKVGHPEWCLRVRGDPPAGTGTCEEVDLDTWESWETWETWETWGQTGSSPFLETTNHREPNKPFDIKIRKRSVYPRVSHPPVGLESMHF